MKQIMQTAIMPTSTAATWSTMECSRLDAWTTNGGHLEASSAKGRPTNSSLTLLRAAHMDDDVIRCHQCITSNSGSALATPDM